MGIMTRAPVVADGAALDAVKTYLRIDGEAEDSLLSNLIAIAVEQCEAFTGQSVLARTMTEVISPCAAWQILGFVPVKSITGVMALAQDGTTSPLLSGAYEIDIDVDARARVRFLLPTTQTRVVVTVQAGLATTWDAVPDSLSQGMIRLVAHYHAHRERADELGPPAAVMALWRGARRVRL